MINQNNSFKLAVAQMVELGKEFLKQEISTYSKLNQCRSEQEQRELEKLYYNEIAATANVIRLFTGRKINFQWCDGADGEFKGGFSLYEIKEDVPRECSLAGDTVIKYNRYSGEQEEDKRIDWGKGLEQGKIVKIYQIIYDKNENPSYVGGYQTPEFQVE